MHTVVEMIFGSHLYGTAGPDSDTDYKGVFLPSARDVLLGHIPRSVTTSTKTSDASRKNTSVDVDRELYSLHYFIELACEGQTVALDMLHAPTSHIITSSDVWHQLQWNRHRFYTRNLSAFVGYARRQAAKYGIRGSRINAIQEVLQVLLPQRSDERLSSVWSSLPFGEHVIELCPPSEGVVGQVQVCGKILQSTATVGYIVPMLTKYCDSYGERAKQAARNEGIDWKAVSHAVRAALQVKELLTDHCITFPLKDAPLIRSIKAGGMNYITEVAPLLESLMDECEALALTSTLPDRVDRSFWDEFIVEVTYDIVHSSR